MATTALLSTPSSVEDGTSDVGVTVSNTINAIGIENDGQPLSTDDAASALLAMGPILPANPEDTTCYWYVWLCVCSAVFAVQIFFEAMKIVQITCSENGNLELENISRILSN